MRRIALTRQTSYAAWFQPELILTRYAMFLKVTNQPFCTVITASSSFVIGAGAEGQELYKALCRALPPGVEVGIGVPLRTSS